MFHPEAPVLKYHQKSSNSCCLSSLASDFHIIGDNMAVDSLANHIEDSLALKKDRFRKRIDFSNNIMKKIGHKGEQSLRYNLNIWNEKGDFDILNEISKDDT